MAIFQESAQRLMNALKRFRGAVAAFAGEGVKRAKFVFHPVETAAVAGFMKRRCDLLRRHRSSTGGSDHYGLSKLPHRMTRCVLEACPRLVGPLSCRKDFLGRTRDAIGVRRALRARGIEGARDLGELRFNRRHRLLAWQRRGELVHAVDDFSELGVDGNDLAFVGSPVGQACPSVPGTFPRTTRGRFRGALSFDAGWAGAYPALSWEGFGAMRGRCEFVEAG